MEQLMLFTKDKDAAMNLQKEGFPLISKTSDGWTFMNIGNHAERLSNRDLKKIVVTNKICI